jgi:hypothetical protein
MASRAKLMGLCHRLMRASERSDRERTSAA